MADRAGSTVIRSGVLVAIGLAALEFAWYCIANVPQIDEQTRGLLKDLVFWSGILLVFINAVIVALRHSREWWKATAISTALVVAGASVLGAVAKILSGAPTTANSSFFGAPLVVRIVAGIAGYAVLSSVLAAAGVLAGGTARWTRALWRTRGTAA